MAKKSMKHKDDPRLAKERRRAKERREEFLIYLLIAIFMGLILYALYLQLLHHS